MCVCVCVCVSVCVCVCVCAVLSSGALNTPAPPPPPLTNKNEQVSHRPQHLLPDAGRHGWVGMDVCVYVWGGGVRRHGYVYMYILERPRWMCVCVCVCVDYDLINHGVHTHLTTTTPGYPTIHLSSIQSYHIVCLNGAGV